MSILLQVGAMQLWQNSQVTGNRKEADPKVHLRHDIQAVVNQCAICFRAYNDDIVEETGEDWIECACGRWVHGLQHCSLC